MHPVAPAKPTPTPARGTSPGVLFPGLTPGEGPGDERRGAGLRCLEACATFRIAADGSSRWLGSPPRSGDRRGRRPLADLDRALAWAPGRVRGAGWVGFLAYDLAGWIEPVMRTGPPGSPLPLAELHRVDLHASAAQPVARSVPEGRPVLRSVQGEGAYTAAAARALEYIRAGDIYQANIAHQLSGRFTGSATDLYAALVRTARPRHGLCLTSAPLADGSRYAVLSLSPELFLAFDARTRRLTTRPMKGTRPGHADPGELRDAEKDRAELAMIVDLMRNDLGRVCEFGSISVDAPRSVERHGTGAGAVLQATATVSGTVREGLTAGDILAATFPPGSVTGTPKIRAMQVIDELEPFARGPYCGCLGTFRDDGSFDLSVAIRTAVIHGRTDPETGDFVDAAISYCVGAGIVADSDPRAEWRETLDKARVLEAVFDLDV